MNIHRALQILSPLDVITFEIEEQTIVKKQEENKNNLSACLVPKALKFLKSGERPDRNPTLWNIVDTKKIEEIEDLEVRLAELLEASSKYNVHFQELDNNSNVATVTSEVSMLVLNCNELTQELLKEAKCAIATTAFGKLDLEIT